MTVLDSERDGLRAARCPAINTLGTVAVTVTDTVLGRTKIITKRGATRCPGRRRGHPAGGGLPDALRQRVQQPPSDPSINEMGEVAFQGNLRRLSTARPDCDTPAQRARRQGVFLGAGGPLTTIAHTINPPGGDFISEFLVADQSVNTFGQVAFVPELDGTFDHGLFVGSKAGTFDQRFLADTPTPDGFNFNNLSSRVSINELGQIAFESGLNDRSWAESSSPNPDGTFRTIVDNTGEFASVGDPSLNIFGRVAFTADASTTTSTRSSASTRAAAAPVTTVAESRPGGTRPSASRP